MVHDIHTVASAAKSIRIRKVAPNNLRTDTLEEARVATGPAQNPHVRSTPAELFHDVAAQETGTPGHEGGCA